MKKINSAAAAALLAVGLAGCEQATAPAGEGRAAMEVGMRGDAASPRSSSSSGARSSETVGSGRIEVAARVYLESAEGGRVELTRGTARQTVEASGSDGVRLLATSEVDARAYRRVRVEFERVEADLAAGVQIGGSLVSGSVQVDGGSDGRVVVERELRVEARSGSVSRIEIDLNSDQWLGSAESGARAVSEAEFSSAVLITAR